jgi:hypothetical protein
MNDYVLLKSLALISLLLLSIAASAAPKKKNRTYSPLLISLLESSGSVAPEYRYALLVTLERTNKSHFIYRKEIKAGIQISNNKKRISEKKFNQITSELLALGADKFKKEELPQEKIMGVSYNEFSFKREKNESHFYYLNKDLEKKNFKIKKEIIQIMKRIKT